MKYLLAIILCTFYLYPKAQVLQLHYDIRHTLDPQQNTKNFPTLYFEYFNIPDSGKAFVKFGPFLFKTQIDFTGDKSNIGQSYMQIFQQLRFWKPKIFIVAQYSGGLGVTNPRQYSYYILNSYSLGVSYPYRIGTAYVSSGIDLKYTPFAKPSIDPSYSFYFYQGLFKYKMEFSGDFTVWTQNKNHGDDTTQGLTGKRLLFFAEPQIWYKLSGKLAVGSKINVYYHTLNSSNALFAYPTAAIRIKL